MDSLYTRQQRLQVMIVTARPRQVVNEIQNSMRRGITIVHDAEGAFHHEEKTILFTIISRAEMYDLEQAMRHSDPYAFVSITDSVKILGHFMSRKRIKTIRFSPSDSGLFSLASRAYRNRSTYPTSAGHLVKIKTIN